jgi:hypothetical protein
MMRLNPAGPHGVSLRDIADPPKRGLRQPPIAHWGGRGLPAPARILAASSLVATAQSQGFASGPAADSAICAALVMARSRQVTTGA